MLLLCCDEGGIHVEGSQAEEITVPDGSNEVGITPFEGRLRARSKEGSPAPALFPRIVFVKGGKVPEDGRGGRDRPVLLFSPPPLRFASLPSWKSLQFDAT